MREFIYNSWNGVMNSNYHPLRHIPDLNTRHLVLQVLAWMWCIVFAIIVGSWTVFELSHYSLCISSYIIVGMV